jgi:TetR/AcrR family transcriptional regulator, lmrAB and yxaGH operons repressor
MPRSTDARAKALDTAERLFRTQGYAATGLTQIIGDSGSPKGSFYFHFPDGKDQLAREVVERYGARGRVLIKQLSAGAERDAPGFVTRLCAAFAAEMRGSDFQLGCVVQNIAGERAPADTPLADALRTALNGWIEAVETHFLMCGLEAEKSRQVALALISGLEGARTVARVQGRVDAFTSLARAICSAIDI